MINQTWESLRIEHTVGLMLTMIETLQRNFKIDGTRCHHILHLELCKFDRILINTFDGLGVLLRCVFRLSLRLCTRDNHLTIFEN